MTRDRSSGSAPGEIAVRALLHKDRYWSAYALGDLDPRRRQHCAWVTDGSSIALVYREFDLPIVWAAGDPDVLDAVPDPGACLLQIPDTFRTAAERRFAIEWLQPMQRMSLPAGAFSPPEGEALVEPLDPSHEDEIRALYADGVATREDPDFFMRSQLGDGTFFGVRQDGQLVAAGGTHLYSANERVAAIGNVYTHRAHRGRGHAAAVTARIAEELIARGTETIALNVKADNTAAIRVYQRLGFTRHCAFYDGRAIGMNPS